MPRLIVYLSSLLSLLGLASCVSSQSAPPLSARIPPEFNAEAEKRSVRQGETLGDTTTFGSFNRAESSVALLEGRWSSPYAVRSAKHYSWSIEIQRGGSPKVRRAILSAKNGYQADLGRDTEGAARFYARFTRKHFSWGPAVSFLVQYQDDATACAPNNAMLYYEVHGITSGGGYTIRAQFGVSHPRLPDSGSRARTYSDESELHSDPDFQLIESCPESDFQPSLKEIDAMLETIRARNAR